MKVNVNEMTLEEKFSQMLDVCPPIERLKIPTYNWWNEALHGIARNGRATVFPQAIGLGATFDEDLVERVATAISDEARAKYNEAIKSFNNVLITNPDVYQVFFNLGNIYYEQKNFDLAIENFQKASAINTNDFEIFNNMGNSYLKKRRFYKSIREL